jgi:hypothetical protein
MLNLARPAANRRRSASSVNRLAWFSRAAGFAAATPSGKPPRPCPAPGPRW